MLDALIHLLALLGFLSAGFAFLSAIVWLGGER
jgi:hypothetical protein